MLANTISFVFATVLSFYLTPFITKRVGIEAYGLVALANSFLSYITLFTAALNSMASRFIIIEIHKSRFEIANEYFSSVLIANIIIALILTLPAGWLILNLEKINVSQYLIFDAQVTFAIVILSFFCSSIGAFYGIVLYSQNILYKGGFRTVESNIIRLTLILLLFSFLDTRIFYVALATFIAGLYPLIWNIHYTHKFLPKLKVKVKSFSKRAIKTLISSGIWNSVTKLSHILLDGVDLLLCNLFIGGVMTGNLSVAKTIPALFISLISVISDSFTPKYYSLYAKQDHNGLFSYLKSSLDIVAVISSICLAIFIVYCRDFYKLWLPGQNDMLISNLTIISLGTALTGSTVYPLFSIFSLTNKLKLNSLVMVGTGVVSFVLTVICLKTTNWGVYAIVGITAILGICRNLIFTPIYGAHCLHLPKTSFYPRLIRNYLNIGVLLTICYCIKLILIPNNWLSLLTNITFCGLIGIVISLFIVFSKEQRKLLYGQMVGKISKFR